MRTALLQIGRTALLCGGLGLLLYVALAEASRFPDMLVPALAAACSGVLSAFLVCEIRDALRTGIAPYRPRAVLRAEEPAWFWGSVLFWGLCLVLTLWLLADSTARVLRHLAG